MQWQAEAIVLNVRPYGESAAIIEVLSKEHGRAAGLVRGGQSRRLRPLLQTGNRLQVRWNARLSEHLGTFTIEPLALTAGSAMQDPLHLTALTTLCALARVLPERSQHPHLVAIFEQLIEHLSDMDLWPAIFIRFELALLDELGFGLDLSQCAATGEAYHLTHISPRTGRAVSAQAALPYLDKLFRLPAFFLNPASPIVPADIEDGFVITGHFLQERAFPAMEARLPESRQRMLALLFRSPLFAAPAALTEPAARA